MMLRLLLLAALLLAHDEVRAETPAEKAGFPSRLIIYNAKDTRRPIYLHSPGGSVRPSYVIARLLRSRKAVARIGRTIATACAGGTQVDAACLKVKTAGGEVEAEIGR